MLYMTLLYTGTYKLAAVNVSGSIEKQVHLSVSGENEEPAPVNQSIDLGPLPVEQLGVFVSNLHANGNLKFKDAYKVNCSLIMSLLLNNNNNLCCRVDIGQW